MYDILSIFEIYTCIIEILKYTYVTDKTILFKQIWYGGCFRP